MLNPSRHIPKPISRSERALCALACVIIPLALGIGFALAVRPFHY